MDWFVELMQNARGQFAGLDSRRQTMFVVCAAGVLTLTAVLWGAAAYDPMVLLFPQPLDPKTTATVLDYLETNEIPHRLEAGTERVYVPRAARDRVAVDLKGSSVMSTKISGLDMINEAPIGSTQFMERRRWTIALQTELETQINGFEQVTGSKVLLSLPEQALFSEDQTDPSASVYVELKVGTTLSTEEGRRMAAMVAAAVPRLDSDRVEILDSELRVIHAARSGDEEYGASSELADLRRQYDRYFQAKAERILERVVGPGKVVAQVSVELDHSERTVHQRELDPDKAVIISSRNREATSEGGATGGVPGTTANIPEVEVGATTALASRSTNEADEVANLDVPETRTHTASLPGRVLSVSASVVVDGTWTSQEATDADGKTTSEKVYKGRSAEELAEYSKLIAAALGTTADKVSIINRPFAQIELTPETSAAAVVPVVGAWVPWAVIALTILCTFLFVVRPAVIKVTAPVVPELPEDTVAQLQAAQARLQEPEPEEESATGDDGSGVSEWLEALAEGQNYVTREEVCRLVLTDVDHSVATLRGWIQEERS